MPGVRTSHSPAHSLGAFVVLANQSLTTIAPNAFADLKKAFKSFLRPNRGRRQQEQQAQQQQQAPAAQQQNEQTAAVSTPDVPPQLPPTHPLVTGQDSEPQNALPAPGNAAAPTAASEGAAKEQVKKQGEDKAPVSPVGPAPVAKDEAPKSEPVSAVSTEHDKPLPLPKTDGANDVKAAGMEQADPQITMRDMKLTFTCEAPLISNPTTQESLPVAASENAKPSVNAPVAATAPATAAPAPTPATTETQPAAKTSSESARDEKMPVMAEEPPEIKAKAAAPGMSATSGPLDDFPIQDDKP